MKSIRKNKSMWRLVKCDSCNEMFLIYPKEMKVETRQTEASEGETITATVHYFSCPKCDFKYIYGIDTPETIGAREAYQRTRCEYLKGVIKYADVAKAAKVTKDICNKALQIYKDSQK